MTEAVKKSLPKWILIISGLFALLEILVSISICFAPESVLETVDFSAKGVDYLVYLWGSRQFAVGVMFAFATIRRSPPMLILSYVFFLVMFLGDFVIGITQKENSLIISAVVMMLISAAMIFAINRKKAGS